MVCEMINGYREDHQEWIEEGFKFSEHARKVGQLSENFQKARGTIGILYDAWVSGKINSKDQSPKISAPLKLDFTGTMWGWLSRNELVVDLTRYRKHIGKCLVYLHKEQPTYRYFVDRSTDSNTIFSAVTDTCTDRLKSSFIYWSEDLKVNQSKKSIGRRFNAMFSFPGDIEKPEHNGEVSRIYALYQGRTFHDNGNESPDHISLRLTEFGSEKEGFFKMKKYPFINQKVIPFNSAHSGNLPLYTNWFHVTWMLDNPLRYPK